MHVVVVDDTGRVTGIKGNIIEKHLNLSKAKDTVSAVNPPDKTYYKDYIALYSIISTQVLTHLMQKMISGSNPRASGFSTACTASYNWRRSMGSRCTRCYLQCSR